LWITRFGLLLLEYGEQMRTDVRRAGVAVAIAAALALTACTPPADGHNPSPSPSVTPLFSSDEEALAAAEEAYAAYQRVEDEVFADGGQNGERIKAVATGEALEAAITGFSNFVAKGYRTVGATTFDSARLQQYSGEEFPRDDVITIYVCLDFSTQDVLDKGNKSVVNPNRALRQPFEVSFSRDEAGSILMSSRDPWTGGNTCDG
jgi:hypothetical protein